jgi:tetratricopeptide (TPR) repeat protein
LKRLAEKLEQLVRDFDSQYGSSGHSVEVDLALRRARATAANARGDHAQALELVTEADAEASVRRAGSQNQEALDNLDIRADAFYGQRRWLLALTNYSRMLTLRSDNVSALIGEGNCHWQLGTSIEGADANRHLDLALRTFRAAAEVCHREQLPQGWAMAQNGLGNTLSEQAGRSEGAEAVRLLNEAVSAYREALKVRIREQFPQDWAMTQNNLGNALSNRAGRSEGAEAVRLLNEAVSAFHRALEVFTEEQFPGQHALVLTSLRGAETSLQKLKP